MRDLDRLVTYYTAGRPRVPDPRFLCFNATLRCNGRCAHCGIWERRSPDELAPAKVAAILSHPLFRRIETAWITGGEPTLREDLVEFASAILQALPRVAVLGITTNALDADRVAPALAGLRGLLTPPRSLFVHISLDGVGPVHDAVRNRNGAFESVSAVLDRIQEMKKKPGAYIEVGLNCVIQPLNVHGLDETADWAASRGFPIIFNLAMATPHYYKSEDRKDDLALSPEEARKAADFLERMKGSAPAPVAYHYRTLLRILRGGQRDRRCLALHSTVNINADGTWITCPASCELSPRDYGKEDPEAIWRDRESWQLRRRIAREICPTCTLSCSLGDAMPLAEYLAGGWEGRPGPLRRLLAGRKGRG